MSIELPPSAAPRPALPQDVLPAAVRRRLLGLAGTGTPVAAYLYDGDVAAARARELRAALPDWASVYYAVKANSFPGIVQALAPHVDGYEVASLSELALATAAKPAAPGAPAPVVAAGPAKSLPVLTGLVEAGVEAINAESPLELHRISRIAVERGTTARVALRVNPAEIPVTGSLHMGGEPSAFGVAEPDVAEAVRLALKLPGIDLVGFHIHAASNNLDAGSHAAYLRWCIEWSAATAAAHGVDLRHIDVGGGIGVAFEQDFKDETPFDVALFGELAAATPPPAGVKVALEPGRFLVADCGWYAAEVTDVKHSYGQSFAALRGGINHFQLPTSWDIVHNVAVLPVDAWPEDVPRPEATGPVTFVGELCTPEDTLLRDVRVGRVRAGDIAVFPYAGSYGWEFAMHAFLGHPVADRILL
ncbi:diaminopimelate decarboxylase [Streptomyces mashuensis]|uniref:Diaminopimelate decarboxylase n=1 Tax=Streptomyces mashuensis TaxID=33904 RepID=A0A919E9T8_9ACTN|nr:type III PLP-dependent enzyme [Streptomyces mashuensis]GHF28588.1 diaminopimelate decarboxylase [Streptomyces mashuensis]